MERAQLVALLLPKRFMICALNLLLIVLPGAGAAVGTYLPGIGVLIRYRPAPKSPGGPNNKSPFGPLSSPLSRISAGGASWDFNFSTTVSRHITTHKYSNGTAPPGPLRKLRG